MNIKIVFGITFLCVNVTQAMDERPRVNESFVKFVTAAGWRKKNKKKKDFEDRYPKKQEDTIKTDIIVPLKNRPLELLQSETKKPRLQKDEKVLFGRNRDLLRRKK